MTLHDFKEKRKMRVYILIAFFIFTLFLTFCFTGLAYDAQTWNVQTIDTNTRVASYGPIAVDSNNYPHIAYANKDFGIMYSSWNGSAWNTQKVIEGKGRTVTSLVLDADNNPHILHDGLTYTVWKESGWTTRTVYGETADSGTLALDSSGNPHIAYTTDKVVKYARWTGSEWNIQNVNSTVNVQSCYLTLDSNNNPHMSFHGVVQDSEAVMLVGPYSYVSPVMYATIPEFPSWTPLLSTLVAVATVSMIYRRRLHNQNQRGEK